MENETLEQQAERLANTIIDSEQTRIIFHRDNEPSLELRRSILDILSEKGCKARFERLGNNQPLEIILSKNQDDKEEDEITGGGW
jgi:hypothetical protein